MGIQTQFFFMLLLELIWPGSRSDLVLIQMTLFLKLQRKLQAAFAHIIISVVLRNNPKSCYKLHNDCGIQLMSMCWSKQIKSSIILNFQGAFWFSSLAVVAVPGRIINDQLFWVLAYFDRIFFTFHVVVIVLITVVDFGSVQQSRQKLIDSVRQPNRAATKSIWSWFWTCVAILVQISPRFWINRDVYAIISFGYLNKRIPSLLH